ncbi:MAG: dTDP-glucose 4,6-dehydratase [Firmicutes bacterium HGW-Firmicutes-1]|jgi:dTDP-glucose 4,6-dehydratase|nr:MAG: dTDP-glucose 4,6-dehydratase [Firmicutes bacterium HGW-Firmicutes-1]
MKTILVTGGAGFIGSTFIIHLLNKYPDYYIINYDKLTYAGDLNNLREAEAYPNYQFINGDIIDRLHLQNIFNNIEIRFVINFAAETHVDRSILDPDVFIKTNVLGTGVLLDVAKKSWEIGTDLQGYPLYKNGVRFIQISTDEVYGTLGKDGMFSELTPLAPNSPYSASKASGDLLVLAYNHTYHLPVVITRCSNNFGPRQYPEKLIPFMIKNALQDEKLPVYGDGMQIRDWIHVEDHCRAIDCVLHRGRLGEVYNVGGSNEKPNIEIVKLILKLLDKDENLIEYVQDRLGHDRRYAIDNTKITTELNWRPMYSFEEGMIDTINWYKPIVGNDTQQSDMILSK